MVWFQIDYARVNLCHKISRLSLSGSAIHDHCLTIHQSMKKFSNMKLHSKYLLMLLIVHIVTLFKFGDSINMFQICIIISLVGFLKIFVQNMLFLSGSPESLEYSSGKVIRPCLLLYEHYHKINKAMGSDALTKDWVDITLVPTLWRYVPQDINGDETVFFYKTTPHCTHCMGEEKPFWSSKYKDRPK